MINRARGGVHDEQAAIRAGELVGDVDSSLVVGRVATDGAAGLGAPAFRATSFFGLLRTAPWLDTHSTTPDRVNLLNSEDGSHSDNGMKALLSGQELLRFVRG